jgi:hypothetical protein
MLLIDYYIVKKINNKRTQARKLKELKELRERLQREHRTALVTAFAVAGLSSVILFRGGSDDKYIIQVDDPKDCGLKEGLSYVDNERIRKAVAALFPRKIRRKLIFITATALCQIVQEHGTLLPGDVPIMLGNFGTTSLYESLRKLGVALLFGTALPRIGIFQNGLAFGSAFVLVIFALRLNSMNLNYLPLTPIPIETPVEKIEPRIPEIVDVVSVNLRNNKVELKPVEKPECLLADQALLNPKCRLKSTQIPQAISESSLTDKDIVPFNLESTDVVNMQDLTKLPRETFSDKAELVQQLETSSNSGHKINTSPKSNLRKGKTVNFIDKYKDPETHDESTSWDVDSNAYKNQDIPAERQRSESNSYDDDFLNE